MEALLVGDRRDDDRREVVLAEQLHGEIHVGRRDVHPGPQRDAIEQRAVAARNQREGRRRQLLLRLFLELEEIDQLLSRRLPYRQGRIPRHPLALLRGGCLAANRRTGNGSRDNGANASESLASAEFVFAHGFLVT